MLSPKDLQKYARSFPIIGKEGQEKLNNAKILVIGIGGLGCPAALYLAASGIGTLGILDHDKVELSNLQRQVLFTEKNIGQEKTASAGKVLSALNPSMNIIPLQLNLTKENAASTIAKYDIILDCTDSLETKRIINQVCISLHKPLVYGAAVREEGQVAIFTKETGCLNCLIQAGSAPSCSIEGILPTVAGIIGILQAHEALSLVMGKKPQPLLMVFSGGEWRTFRFSASCSLHHSFKAGGKRKTMEFFHRSKKQELVAEPAPALQQESEREILPQEVKELREKGKVELIDVREQWEWDICHIDGAKLIPMSMLAEKSKEFKKEKFYITYCHTGVRSLHAQHTLASQGFKVKSLQGGIARWTDEIDPSLERY